MDINNAKSRVEELTNLLNYHNNLYYNQDNPEISDYEYDKLLRELEDLEKQFPTLLKKDSPTQKVGGSAGEKFSEVTHTVQMMSLHDSFSHGELLDFDRKVREVGHTVLESGQNAGDKRKGTPSVMNYGEIKNFDIANGEGVRVSLFVSGCTHHCKGCFNPETWNFGFGSVYTKETEDSIMKMLSFPYIDGLSLLGGEPFEPDNQRDLVKLLKRVRAELPDKDIWCYSGYIFDKELLSESRARCEVTDEMLSLIDVLVDGEFVEELKNVSLVFRGSSNQRIIDVKKSLESGEVVPYKLKMSDI